MDRRMRGRRGLRRPRKRVAQSETADYEEVSGRPLITDLMRTFDYLKKIKKKLKGDYNGYF